MATRNIPAHAGKTAPPAPDVEHSQEYPRVCGENGSTAPWPGSCRGTSPRMRGKPFQVPVVVAHVGNILAYAGKTRWHCACSRSSSEHPRVCGENAARAASVKPLVGTSPRMRGKLPTQIGLKESRGNIPAYAGKTQAYRQCQQQRWGTSPHTRGKRCGCGSDCGSNGNIPAYAGKTSRARPL